MPLLKIIKEDVLSALEQEAINQGIPRTRAKKYAKEIFRFYGVNRSVSKSIKYKSVKRRSQEQIYTQPVITDLGYYLKRIAKNLSKYHDEVTIDRIMRRYSREIETEFNEGKDPEFTANLIDIMWILP